MLIIMDHFSGRVMLCVCVCMYARLMSTGNMKFSCQLETYVLTGDAD